MGDLCELLRITTSTYSPNSQNKAENTPAGKVIPRLFQKPVTSSVVIFAAVSSSSLKLEASADLKASGSVFKPKSV